MSDRQIGRTTTQMRDAPHRAVFVWCNERLDYPRHLANHIGRDDLRIVSPVWLEEKCRGQIITGLVIDHAAYLSYHQIIGIDAVLAMVESVKKENKAHDERQKGRGVKPREVELIVKVKTDAPIENLRKSASISLYRNTGALIKFVFIDHIQVNAIRPAKAEKGGIEACGYDSQ